jgi:hypothetical protein
MHLKYVKVIDQSVFGFVGLFVPVLVNNLCFSFEKNMCSTCVVYVCEGGGSVTQ